MPVVSNKSKTLQKSASQLIDVKKLKNKAITNGNQPQNFSSGLKLPKLEPDLPISPPINSNSSIKTQSSIDLNLNRKVGGANNVDKDKNEKIRQFKNAQKSPLLSTTPAPTQIINSNSIDQNSSDDNSEDDEISIKVQELLQLRKPVSLIDSEIQNRISDAYLKMEVLEKGVKSFDQKLQLAHKTESALNRALVDTRDEASAPIKMNNNDEKSSRGVEADEEDGSPKLNYEDGDINDKLDELGVRMSQMFDEEENDEDYSINNQSNNSEDDDYLDNDDDGPETPKVKDSSQSTQSTSSPKITMIEKSKKILSGSNSISSPRNSAAGEIKSKNMSILALKASEERMAQRLKRREKRVAEELEKMKSQVELLNSKGKRENRNKIDSYNYTPSPSTQILDYNPNQGPSKDLSEFLQLNGGTTGGWDKDDHGVFMAAYLKWRHKPAQIVRLVSMQCPSRKSEDVAKHIEWYEKYDALNKANKSYVRGWNNSRKRERKMMFEMAKSEAKSKLDSIKMRQESMRRRREAEKEQEKISLNKWRNSKKTELEIASGVSLAEKALKFNEEVQRTKNEIIELLPPGHESRKLLSKVFSSSSTRPKSQMQLNHGTGDILTPLLNTDSVFNFSNSLTMHGKNIESGDGDGDRGDNFETFEKNENRSSLSNLSEKNKIRAVTSRGNLRQNEISTKVSALNLMTSLESYLKRGTNKKLLASFRARDDKFLSDKMTAIKRDKESKRNKAFLTTEEAKKRISEISLPSQVEKLTIGAKMRQNMRHLEEIEQSARAELAKDRTEQHKLSRVPTPKMFKSSPTIRSVPKLGMPSWKTY